MDQTDVKIIQMLKNNARVPNVEIAKEVGLTEGAVRNRIEKMVRNRMITRFTVDLSSANSLSAIVMLKAKGETKKMMTELSKSRIANEAHEISGDFDGCVIIEGGSMEALDRKVDKIRKIKEVADTKTFISFKRW